MDRAPPRVLAHTPAADTTGVAPDTRVELVFSEAMDRRRTEDALFISPTSQVEYRWRGRRLQLHFPEGLQSGRTYVITAGTGARDLRGNALGQSFTLAFATGDRLNQGRVKGRVFNRLQPAGAAHVWAYDLERFAGRLGTDPPDYRTQSGSDGAYEFSRLSAGRYRLLAFADGNSNLGWDAGEPLALPAADLEVTEETQAQAGDLDLFPAALPAPRLMRVQSLNQRRLLLQFDQDVEQRQVVAALEGLAVEGRYQLPHEPRKLYLQTAPQEAGRSYNLELAVDGQPLKWREPVRGSGRPDQAPPSVARQYPGKGALAPEDSLALVFSEAMAPVALEDIWVPGDSSQIPAGRWKWADPVTLVFAPATPWSPGTHRLRGRTALLRDLGSLALQDSLLIFEFEVPVKSASIAGQIFDRAGAPVAGAWVSAQSQEHSYGARTDAGGHYLLKGLLPGAYRVSAFVDLDLNQQQGRGTLEPFTPSEPYACHPEAVALSPGGSAAGIDLFLTIP